MSQENNFIPSQEPYKPLSAFHLFVKSNFPFIENTYEALDNYGLYCKIVEYLNNVISNENAVESNVTDLYNAFVSLNTYVSDYFDNLDVQEEINNKLDELAENGYLESLIEPYIGEIIQPQIDNISNTVNNQIARYDVLEGRVDQITQLPSGSTQGDAELADIRVDNAGFTYPTAGDSVRGQTLYNESIFNDTLNDLLESNINELNRVEKQTGYYYNNGSNKTSNNTTYCYSKIKVNNGDTIYFKRLFAYYSWFVPNTTSTPDRLSSNTQANVSGNYTCNDNGYLYITVSNSITTPIVTKSQTMANNDITNNYYNLKDSLIIKPVILKPILPLLKAAGFIYDEYSFRYTQANGGVVSNEILTIPSGSSGYTSSIARIYNVDNFITSDNELYAVIAVDTTFTYDYRILFIYQGANQYITSQLVSDYYENNIHYYIYKLNYQKVNDRDYPIGVYISIYSQTVLSSDATIKFDDCYLLSKYNAKSLDSRLDTVESYISSHDLENVYLDVGTNKDYTSLRTALEYASQHYSAAKRHIIRLYFDEYDVSNDITESDLNDSSFVGLQVRKNTKIIGMNNQLKNKILLELSSDLSNTIKSRISPINLFDNAELENLTIESTNCRYAVHDDFSDNPSESQKAKTIKNCNFKTTNSYYHVCYGSGLKNGSKWLFENCIFESGTNDTRAFSCHNAASIDIPTSIEFNNCQFKGNNLTNALRLGSLNNGTDTIVNCKLLNSYFASTSNNAVLLNEESAASYGSGCKFNVLGSCNNIGNTDITITTTDSVDYSDRKNLINKIS